MAKINLQEVAKLNFLKSSDGRFISAASGLVKNGNTFYVIADDQLSLGIFTLGETIQHQMVPLINGELPQDSLARKKVKPDWEALVLIPQETEKFSIFAVPSGSKPQRRRGVAIEFGPGSPTTREIDFSNLYIHLEKQFPELNIEGAVVQDNVLKLFQRGNGKLQQNAIIDLDLGLVLRDIKTASALQPSCVVKVTNYELGKLQNANLSFTDACFSEDGHLYFLAVAEDVLSTYEDGEFRGAVVGCIDDFGQIISIHDLDCPFKPEGLWVEKIADRSLFYIVTDADDSEQVSTLYCFSEKNTFFHGPFASSV